MESRINKSKTTNTFRGRKGGKSKSSTKNGNKRNAYGGRTRKKEGNDDKMSEVITEFDEAERLCLPHYNFMPTTRIEINHTYPTHYNVSDYQKLETAVDRHKYRNSKDLRSIHRVASTENVPENEDHRPCYTQLRGQKCGDVTCMFKHEFRMPRKLRLCNEWKKGACADGQSCLYLHSEFPCRFHYLGLKKPQHDPQNCRYYHGGPLPKEYEEMFLNSIDLKRHPMSREMYKNQLVQLKGTPAVVELKTVQQEPEQCPAAAVESVVVNSLETVAENEVIDSDACQQKDPESSDESCLQIDDEAPE